MILDKFFLKYEGDLKKPSLIRVNSESIVTPSHFSWELAAREIPSIETISGLLILSKIWDFPVLTFKWLFLYQQKNLVAEAYTSNGRLGLSVAHEFTVVSSG